MRKIGFNNSAHQSIQYLGVAEIGLELGEI